MKSVFERVSIAMPVSPYARMRRDAENAWYSKSKGKQKAYSKPRFIIRKRDALKCQDVRVRRMQELILSLLSSLHT